MFWRLEETRCHSNSSERPSANAYVKKLSRSNNKITESNLIAAKTSEEPIELKRKSIICKCRLSSDKDETINPIMKECCKVAQKMHKSTHD